MGNGKKVAKIAPWYPISREGTTLGRPLKVERELGFSP